MHAHSRKSPATSQRPRTHTAATPTQPPCMRTNHATARHQHRHCGVNRHHDTCSAHARRPAHPGSTSLASLTLPQPLAHHVLNLRLVVACLQGVPCAVWIRWALSTGNLSSLNHPHPSGVQSWLIPLHTSAGFICCPGALCSCMYMCTCV